VCELALFPPEHDTPSPLVVTGVLVKLAYIATLFVGFAVSGVLGAWLAFAGAFIVHVWVSVKP
jgi:hypothetical protein